MTIELTLTEETTRVDAFTEAWGTWYAKREDTACARGAEYPAGAKVRQFNKMAARCPGAPMIVGCSALAGMQIYLAAAAEQNRVPGIIYIPARATETDATRWAREHGVEVNTVRPGFPSTYKKRARERARELGRFVRWDRTLALEDTMQQCVNLPAGVKRIITPTGSGMTAAAVLAGLAELGRTEVEVLSVRFCTLGGQQTVLDGARKLTEKALPRLTSIVFGKYADYMAATLPDGTPLDPFYSAKILHYVERDGDLMWLTGVRPLSAMPAKVRSNFL